MGARGCPQSHLGLCLVPLQAEQVAVMLCVTARDSHCVSGMAALAQSVPVTGSNWGIGLQIMRQLAASPCPPSTSLPSAVTLRVQKGRSV